MEADLGVDLHVKELRRGQVRIPLLLARVDARHVDGALEDRRLAGRVKRALEVAEPTAYGRDAHVPNLETDVRVGRVDVVGSGGDGL